MEDSFGGRLEKLRKEQGLTQAMLGNMLSRGDSTVRMWELNRNHPNHEYLLRLAQIFGVSTDYLLGRNAPQEEATPKTAPVQAAVNLRPDLCELLELADSASDEELASLLRMARGFLQR